jgi:hypothetical protein
MRIEPAVHLQIAARTGFGRRWLGFAVQRIVLGALVIAGAEALPLPVGDGLVCFTYLGNAGWDSWDSRTAAEALQNVHEFALEIKAASPRSRVFIPEYFKPFAVDARGHSPGSCPLPPPSH